MNKSQSLLGSIPFLGLILFLSGAFPALAQQSTSGPDRPPGVSTGIVRNQIMKEQGGLLGTKLIQGVPAYLWLRGCGPTALGMVIGYYDLHGFPDLIEGIATEQTIGVDAAIASTDHYDDYSLPKDYSPNLKKDKSELGSAHISNCIADFMKTSWSSRSNYWGWSWSSDVMPAFENYLALKNNRYRTVTDYVYYSDINWWDKFTNEIDNNRPVVLLVDSDGDGGTDHFVTGIGYDNENQLYAIYDTWDRNVHWYQWRKMAEGVEWGIFGFNTFEILPDNCPNSATLNFSPGWNIFASPVSSANSDIQANFQALIDNSSLVKIQDETGNSLENWGAAFGWKNTIGNLAATEGYKIRMNFLDSLQLCGSPVEFPFAITLKPGWNIVGYPQTAEFDAMEVVHQLQDQGSLVKVQDETGASIEDWGGSFGWQNNIGNCRPGKGYKVKVNTTDTLWIYESYPKSTTVQPVQRQVLHFQPAFEGNGVDHMNINLKGLSSGVLSVGDELAVFDGDVCAGAVVLLPHHFASQSVSITASAADGQGVEGFKEGNSIRLKLWKADKNLEFNVQPEILKGPPTFTKHVSVFASLEKYVATGFNECETNATEINCYPNPFSKEVNIEIKLTSEAPVQAGVFNQLGQKVKVLRPKTTLHSGLHHLVWSGMNNVDQRVSPGVYLIKIKIADDTYFEKVVLSSTE